MFVLANGHLSISHATVHLAFYDVQVSPSIGFLESRLLCNVNQDGGRPVQRFVVFVGCLLKKTD